MAGTAYNPADPAQQSFLAALALGETGTASDAYSLGVGTSGDLAGAPTSSSGFPQFSGWGGSHAAGAYQFQPSTWEPIAAAHGLNFQNPADQNAGAWYEAQSAYSSATNGGDLETALANPSDYGTIQSALKSIWPSVTGGPATAAPAGLAADLASGTGSPAVAGTAGLGLAGGGTGSGQTSGGGGGKAGGVLGFVGDAFTRFGLLIAGGLIVFVALWQLVSNTGAVPSPAQTVKAGGRALATIAEA